MDTQALAEQVRIAKREVERAKMRYANKAADYSEMAEAARYLADLMYQYSCAKYPAMRHRRIPYQAILR